MTNANGGIRLTQNFDPYGNWLSGAGQANAHTYYGYTGEWTDPTGLLHLRARHYAPGLGRFLSRDTWPGDYRRPQTFNAYGYVSGNPINYTDPSGHCIGPAIVLIPLCIAIIDSAPIWMPIVGMGLFFSQIPGEGHRRDIPPGNPYVMAYGITLAASPAAVEALDNGLALLNCFLNPPCDLATLQMAMAPGPNPYYNGPRFSNVDVDNVDIDWKLIDDLKGAGLSDQFIAPQVAGDPKILSRLGQTFRNKLSDVLPLKTIGEAEVALQSKGFVKVGDNPLGEFLQVRYGGIVDGLPVEVRIKYQVATGEVSMYRIGAQVYEPSIPVPPPTDGPYNPDPADEPGLMPINHFLIRQFGPRPPQQARSGSWAGKSHYIDAGGWIYFDIEGGLTGLSWNDAHIKP